eukprot:6807363-Pyramimonas_sp.AAC.1
MPPRACGPTSPRWRSETLRDRGRQLTTWGAKSSPPGGRSRGDPTPIGFYQPSASQRRRGTSSSASPCSNPERPPAQPSQR